MIYDKLRKLPKVIQMEIYESGDLTLLTDEERPIEELIELWAKLDEEFNRKYNKDQTDKVFELSKEIDYQENRYLIINSCCEQLLFDKTPEVIDILRKEGYKFDENSKDFKPQIDRIHRESKGILIKIKQLKDKLPKQKENSKEKFTIIDVMTNYESIRGVPFDYNTISVEAFHSIESQVFAKVKNIEKQIAQSKSKK